ncbi:threonine aldolase family protein [Aureibacter tunicatorum]|uniref:Threonine aldolase n=1 Tax=Aureibacter tunicatorum TaxID=866807 RepID=A0AAE4BSV0_9BACT|nr:aminotransferase class I/II-fold pyridoxal phosphate-dependent enzyme [Aureibacter tunicatorum]MDR6238812.1 threonine aldolase [Aureibacter tunicatorum]BDD05261.1 amino acid lyase [Aureibacter tunicatorum]
MKISFKNDYSEGCHPKILEALMATNLEQQDGYGLDEYSLKAKQIIVDKLQSPASKVFFVSGGTQANLVAISSFLKPYQSVISAETGHIFDNETGAIEATGHKVNPARSVNGKLTKETVQEVLDAHQIIPHQLMPKVVYISNATEIGTVYNASELKELYEYCQSKHLYLYMDGARLGQAIMSASNDLKFDDLAKYTDAFYLGATKNGGLIGEAIVINNPALHEGFDFVLKQKGALLSKGRLLGLQFLTLFEGDLFFELAKVANDHARMISKAFKENGCKFWAETQSNQIFPILDNDKIEVLAKDFDFYVWRKLDNDQSAIRIITSWATKEENLEKFVVKVNELK